MAQQPAANGVNLNLQNQPAVININFGGPPEEEEHGLLYIYTAYNGQQVGLYLPPRYDPNQIYRVMQVFPAAGGNGGGAWFKGVYDHLNRLIMNLEIQPVIAVAPNLHNANLALPAPLGLPAAHFMPPPFALNGQQMPFILNGNPPNMPWVGGGNFPPMPHPAANLGIPLFNHDMGGNAVARALFANNPNGNAFDNGNPNPVPLAVAQARVPQILNGILTGVMMW